MTKLKALLVLSLLIGLPVFAQTVKIPLWDGPAPGTEGRQNTEVVSETGNISQVFQPEMTYYPAPDQTMPVPAVLVCPGGGYRNIVMAKEGVRIAQWLNRHGIAAFVLKYRLNSSEAVQDARRSMRLIRRDAAKYHIDPAKIGVMGFSAGGHLSANLAFNYDVSDASDSTDAVSARPDTCAPIYGSFNGIRRPKNLSRTPPFFLAHAVDDKTVPVEQSLDLFRELKAKDVPVEMHLYEQGGHGFALDPQRGYASSWGEAFVLWLKARGVEAKAAAKP